VFLHLRQDNAALDVQLLSYAFVFQLLSQDVLVLLPFKQSVVHNVELVFVLFYYINTALEILEGVLQKSDFVVEDPEINAIAYYQIQVQLHQVLLADVYYVVDFP